MSQEDDRLTVIGEKAQLSGAPHVNPPEDQMMMMERGAWKEDLASECSSDFLLPPEKEEELASTPFSIAKEPPRVDFVIYPDQVNDFKPKPFLWSLWGKGCNAADGCFYSAVGDHDGPDGETKIYQFDPVRQAIRRVFSWQALMGHQAGDWGFGKIHGQLVADEEGWIYFAGYWGNFPQKEDDLNERCPGGAIGRYNAFSHLAEKLGVPVPGPSWPIHSTDTGRGLMYLLGTDNSFACYDLKAGRLRYHGSEDIQKGQRGIIVDTEKGTAYFNVESPEGIRLARYDPEANTVTPTKAFIPTLPPGAEARGGSEQTLRSATDKRAADGWFYCVAIGGALFRFLPETEEIEDLGPNFGKGHYTAGIGMSPKRRYIYFVPGAHGTCWQVGTPVIQYDIETRERKVLAFLEGHCESRYQYRLGGTFGTVASPDGSRLFIPMNGNTLEAVAEQPQAFGMPAMLVVHIPESERQE